MFSHLFSPRAFTSGWYIRFHLVIPYLFLNLLVTWRVLSSDVLKGRNIFKLLLPYYMRTCPLLSPAFFPLCYSAALDWRECDITGEERRVQSQDAWILSPPLPLASCGCYQVTCLVFTFVSWDSSSTHGVTGRGLNELMYEKHRSWHVVSCQNSHLWLSTRPFFFLLPWLPDTALPWLSVILKLSLLCWLPSECRYFPLWHQHSPLYM